MSVKFKLGALTAAALALIGVFLFVKLGGNWEYVLPRRAYKILAIALTGAAIGFATTAFQTMTNNRILTPNIIGLDSMYVLVQTFIIFAYGSVSVASMNKALNFGISVAAMIGFSVLLYQLLFRRPGRHIYFLLLVGVVMGTLFGSLTTFMQVLIDPNEFLVLQGRMFASFNNIDTDLLWLSFALFAAAGLYSLRLIPYLDAMSLGREQAINLGVDYEALIKKLLAVIAVLISLSTALVGPITFLGLLIANLAVQFMRTHRHRHLLPASMLLGVIALVGGQLLVERVFTFATTVSVIVNFAGGIYFLYLLLKENRSW
ncbi:iron chelate uptake ABC transporter family permease subunit [Paenibacillus sp.]|uniref:iron chelate uptake ABC transporter family permease subunit n=1 Tax=Paenibacillus sp. TaxID=58172 RepID=UPI002D226D60|nr:iron chelate uptake ABC transporter family permease subunit [Paenibacillus sp.]HZG88405.1 iron chelate uptake ABC transporter family permease subunit [Paenibacillus sp.]